MTPSILLAFSLALHAASPKQPVALDVQHCDFGERYQLQAAECTFKLRNDGKIPLHVRNIKPASPGDTVSISESTIAPGKSLEIVFHTNTADRLGQMIRFVSFDVEGEPRRLIAKGFVLSDLDDAAQGIDFGTVDADKGSEPRSVTLVSHAVPSFRIERIIESPDWVDVKVDAAGVVTARVKPGAPWSPQEARIRLAINTPHQHEAWVPVSANLQGAVIPSSSPYEIGAVHQGSTIEFALRLNSRNGKAFKVGKTSSDGVRARIVHEPCIPASVDCAQLKVTLPKDLPLGIFRGNLLVELPDYSRTLPITFGGFVVAKTTIIKKAPDALAGSSSAAPTSAGAEKSVPDAAQPVPKMDFAGALRNSVAQSAAQADVPAGTGPLLKWQVMNEKEVHGYLIYRSEQEKGPFVRINDDIVRVASDGTGWTYQWRDNSAKAGSTYWYYVATINQRGQIQPLSGPQKVVAK